MKRKFTFLIAAAVMLLTMMATTGTMWGQTTDDLDFSFSNIGSTGWTNSYAQHVVEFDNATVTFASASKQTGTITNYPVTKGQPVSVVLNESTNNITSVTFTCVQWGTKAQTITLHYSTNGGTSYTSTGITSNNFTISSNNLPEGTNAVKITFSSTSNQVGIGSCSVTFESGGSSSLQDSDLALTDAPIALEFDLYNNSDAQVINYSTSSTGAVTVSESEFIETEVDETNKTITVTPIAVTNTAQTITVSQAADDNYKAGSQTFTVSITDSTPFVGGDVTFVAGTDKGTSTGQNPDQISKSGVTVAGTSAALATSEYRFYSGSTTTISTTSGNITQIIFTGNSTSYPVSRFSVNDNNGEYSVDNNVGTWAGNSTSISFSASGQARASQIVVTVAAQTSDPYITAANVDIDYDATGGNIAFTVNNEVTGGTISAATSDSWITLGSETTSPITFTCSANSETIARTAEVTLTYTYNTNETVTKDVTITQAAAPVVYSTIPALFAAATTTETNVEITFDSWVVSGVSNKNVFVTDNNGNGFVIFDNAGGLGDVYSEGDILTGTAVSCTLKLYNGFAEILNLSSTDLTIADGGTVTVADIEMASLAGVNTGALLHYDNLTCSISNNKYYLSDGTTTIQVYNALFAFDALEDGKSYNITGVYQQYNNTKEILPRSADDIEEVISSTPVINADNVNIAYDATSGEIAYTISNPDGTSTLGATTTADWVSNIAVTDDKVTFTTTTNEGTEDRVATFTLTYTGAENKVVTVTQGHFVVDYATLPFEYDGDGTGTLPTGFTVNGLGTYSSSPKMQFNSTGDWAILKFNERPGTLTFDIKGNSFSDGKFTVQTSEDGTTYTDLETYTELGSTQSESFNNLGENVRYIKWIYTEKVNGNVALGNISLAEYVEPAASITVDPATVNAPIEGEDGTLTVTYTNITDVVAEVYFCDVNGDAATYGWIYAGIDTNNNVEYIIDANTGEARTAYFKVWAYDDSMNEVYSNLVTVTQAGVTPTFAIIFDVDGGTFVGNDDFPTDTEEKEAGTYALPSATKESTNFAGWLLDGTEDIYAAGASFEVTTDASFTAQWSNSVTATINFSTGTGNTPITSASVTGDDSAGNTWTITTVGATYFSASNVYTQIGTSSKPAESITFTTTLPNNATISAFSAKFGGFSGTTGTVTLAVGETTVGTGTIPASADVIVENTSTAFGNVLTVTVTNILKGVKAYYISYTYTLSTDPIISAPASIDLASDATEGEFEYSIINPATGVSITAESNDEWISDFVITDEKVTFTTTVNTESAERQGTITLSYTGAENKTVTVIQAAPVTPVASITVDPATVNAAADGENGTLTVTYENITISEASDFDIQFYDSEENELNDEPNWLVVEVEDGETSGYVVSFIIYENDGEARTAYFKVFAMGSEDFVYSNLVTINQAEYVAPTYTVTYNANGGIGTMTDPNSPYTENTQVTLLENTFTAPEGKIWDSWLVKDADQTTIAVNNNTFTMPASNVTVTAQWVDDPYAPTYEWVLTALEDLTSNDVFVIVGNNGSNYAMTNDNGTTNAPATAAVIVANNKLTNAPANNLKWNLEIGTNGYTFYPNGVTNKWLYCTDANNGLRVGTEDNKVFAYEEVTITDKEGYYLTITPASDKRYVCIYNNSDWRSYKSGSIVKTDTKFYKRQVASTDPQLSANDVNIESDVTAGEITYTLENAVQGGELTAEITAGNEDNWLTLGNVGETTVSFTCEANTEQTERTATVTLTYTYNETSISATAVVTQAALIIDYATMPFAFDGGRADIENVNGLTQEGLDSDYGSSPKLKFNTTGDWMVLKLNAKPVSIIYDIKGNSFSGGKFTVQVSEDGIVYDDLEEYTTLGEVQTDHIINNNPAVRYIKWVYTDKSNGNVALGNIKVYDVEVTIINDNTTINDLTIGDNQGIVVSSDVVLTLTGTVTNTYPEHLIIEEGGQLIHENNVNATVQKGTTAPSSWKAGEDAGWYLIATPVASTEIATAFTGTFDLYKYSEPDAMWYTWTGGASTFDNITRGNGYLHASQTGETASFAGEMIGTEGTLTKYSLSYAYSGSGDNMKGFNLVGNPFTRNLTKGDMTLGGEPLTKYYVINDAQHSKLTAVDDDSYEIKPGEGFFVQATAANQDLVFNPTTKGMNSLNNGYIKIVAGNEDGTDNAYIQLGNGNTLRKMDISNKTSVYVINDGDDYAAARVEELAGSMLVNFKAAEDGEYTITVNAKNIEAHTMMLFDDFTGETIDLLETPSYTFNASVNDSETRFKLIFDFNTYTGIGENYTNGNFAYQTGDEILVSGEGTLQVFDVMGRYVASFEVNGSKRISTSLFNTGVYIFKMNGENAMTQKIVVR